MRDHLNDLSPFFTHELLDIVDVEAGWVDLLNNLVTDLEAINDEFIATQIMDVSSGPKGLIFEGVGFTDEMQRRIELAQAESYYICEICGHDSRIETAEKDETLCSGCRLIAKGKVNLPPGWANLAQKIIYEIETLSTSPIEALDAFDGSMSVSIEGHIMTEQQEVCFRLWRSYLRQFCCICGTPGKSGRCPAHLDPYSNDLDEWERVRNTRH